jgi:hypothetical protein
MEPEEKWVAETIHQYTVEELADFLSGNPDPTFETLLYCADGDLGKVLLSIIRATRLDNDDLADEIVSTSVRALVARVENNELRLSRLISTMVQTLRLLTINLKDEA